MLALVACSGSQPTTADEPAPTGSFVHPEEAEQAHLACMREQGFAAELHPGGGISYDAVPEAQSEALIEADGRCQESIQVDPRYRQSLDDEQLRWLYVWYVEESIPCLESEGFVGFSPPSEESFVENYYVEPWTPYFDLEERLGAHRLDPELEERCPKSPGPDALLEQREGS